VILGAHESVAGGLEKAFARGRADGCRALQIFTSSSRQWAARELPPDEVAAFRREASASRWPVLSHASYLINLGTADRTLRDKSVAALRIELERAEALGLDYVVLHPGTDGGGGEAAGLVRVAECLSEVHLQTRGARARILLELTAGQGSCLGHRFEHLRTLLEVTDGGDRLGVCFDTCHAVAAGYDLAGDYQGVWRAFDRIVGLSRLCAFHLNDSKKGLGCRVDRHHHPGEGSLGLATFRRLVRDRRFAGLPGILETPPLPGGEPSFRRNLERLRALL
jgi:deoxyribonuclease-4